MEKKYFLIALFIGLATSGYSQFEVKGFLGMNFSSLTDVGEGFTQSPEIGYQLGASVLIGTTWFLEPGVTYSVSSQAIEESSITNSDPFSNKITGVKVPLNFGYRFFGGTQNLLNLRLFAGASANFVTGINIEDISIDKEFYNSILWNANVGAGLDVWFLFLDLGYEIGLSDTFKGEDVLSTKMNTFYINVGGRIKFGK